jgi:hypothetical protein
MDGVMMRLNKLSSYGIYLVGQEYVIRAKRALTKGFDDDTAKYLRDCLARCYFSKKVFEKGTGDVDYNVFLDFMFDFSPSLGTLVGEDKDLLD